MIKLLRELKTNATLATISLAYNTILEEQPLTLTQEQIAEGLTDVPLSAHNLEALNCFKDHIKYKDDELVLKKTDGHPLSPVVKSVAIVCLRVRVYALFNPKTR